MLTITHLRAARRRRPADERGFTLIEVIVALLVLGIIMTPLTAAFITSIQRTTEVETAVGATADAQRIASFWTRDVHNVEANGVLYGNSNPSAPTAVTPCPASIADPSAGGTPLITFQWDTATSADTVSKKATWAIEGSGPRMQLVRRYCENGSPALTTAGMTSKTFIAGSFWVPGTDIATDLIHGPVPGEPLNFCPEDPATGTSPSCTISVTGNFTYQLTVDRRVPGVPGDLGATLPCPEVSGAVGGNGTILVGWSPVFVDSGVPPITEYRVIIVPQIGATPVGTHTGPATVLQAEFTGLTNGADYWVQTQAANENGYGALCSSVGPFSPTAVAPSEPTDVAAARGDEQITVSWDVPDDDGGAAVSAWTVRTSVAATSELVSVVEVPGGAARSTVVPDLENGTEVQATVGAVNAAGEGPESEASNRVTPCGVPGQALVPIASAANDQKLRLVLQAGDANGCDVIQYRVYAFENGSPSSQGPWLTESVEPGEAPPSEFTTPQLPLVEYQLAVAAINEIGEGALSPLTSPVVLNPVPDPVPLETLRFTPKYQGQNSGNAARSGGLFQWIPLPNTPEFNNGFSIDKYVVTLDPVTSGASQSFNANGANASQLDMAEPFKQTDGAGITETYKEYDLSVSAHNANGESPKTTIRVVPGNRPFASPTGWTSRGYSSGISGPGSSAVRIAWDPILTSGGQPYALGQALDPTVDGGRNIVGYQVQWYKAGTTGPLLTFNTNGVSTSPINLRADLGGFDPGAEYLVRVAARNDGGASIPSSWMSVWGPTRPAPPPSAVTLTRPAGTAGNRLALFIPAFYDSIGQPFTSNPGNPPLDYSATCTSPGETAVDFPNLTTGTNILDDTRLINGAAWSCTAKAAATLVTTTYAASKAASAPATPSTTPGTPGPVTVTALGGGNVQLDWVAPTSNGGNTLAGYTISSSPAAPGFPATVSGTTTTFTSPNALTFGQSYTFSVVATNLAGSSGPSTSPTFTPSSSVPVAPTALTTTPVYRDQITFTWAPVPDTAPQNGGLPLTGQTITLSPAPTTGSATVTLPIGDSSYTYTTDQKVGGSFQDYTATVVATNANGDGPSVQVTGRAGGAPTLAPTGLTLEPFNASGTITVKWNPLPFGPTVADGLPGNGGKKITHYYVTWSTGGGPILGTAACGGENCSKSDLGGLTPGTAYTFNVYASNDGTNTSGHGPTASVVGVVPGSPTPQGSPAVQRPGIGGPASTLYLTFPAWTVTTGSPAISDYSSTCTPTSGGTAVTQSGLLPGQQNSLTGLLGSTSYDCTLTGTNTFPKSPSGSATLNVGTAITR